MIYERIPKNLSSIEDTIHIGDSVIHKRLIDSNYREAVIDGYDNMRSDTIRSTVMLPVWLRREVAIISIDEDVSQGKLYTAMTNHGTALLQELSRNYVSALQAPLRVLFSSNNTYIVDFMQNFSLSVNGLGGGQRRTLLVPVWAKSYIGKIQAYFRVDFSSLMRLSLYLSIQRYDGILEADKIICDAEITKFESNVRDFSEVCNALMTTKED